MSLDLPAARLFPRLSLDRGLRLAFRFLLPLDATTFALRDL
jgi:hypothetical protein